MWLLLVALHARSATLEEHLQAALENSPEIVSAEARADSAAAGVTIARSTLLPSLSVTGTYTRNDHETAATLPLPEGPKELVLTPLDQWDARARLTIPLLDPSSIAGLQAAGAQKRAGRAGRDLSREATLLSVVRTYYFSVAADRVVLAAKESEAAAEASLAVARTRSDLNALSPLDLQRAEAEAARARQSRLAAEADARDQRRNLAALTGLDAPADPAFELRPTPSGDLLERALAANSDVQVADAAARAARASRASALWRYSPVLSGFGQVSASNATGFSGSHFAGQVGLQAQWVLFDGGAREGRVAQSRASVVEAESRLERSKITVEDDLATAIDARTTAEAMVEASTRARVATAEARRLAEERFALGDLDAAPLALARRDAFEAEVGLARAEAQLAISIEQIRFLVGEPIASP